MSATSGGYFKNFANGKRKKKDIEDIKLRDGMVQNIFTADDFIDHH